MWEAIKDRLSNASKWLGFFATWWEVNVSDRDGSMADESYEDWLDRQY